MKFNVLLLAMLIAWLGAEYGGEKPLPAGWKWTSARADTANCKAFAGERQSLFSPRAISVRCTTTAEGFAAARFSFPLDGLRGKHVTLIGMARAQDVSASARLWLRVDRPGQYGVQMDMMERRALRGTTDWVTESVAVDVPEDASTLFGGIILFGSGTISLADARVVVLAPGGAAPPEPK
jgi:hypothetical protein